MFNNCIYEFFCFLNIRLTAGVAGHVSSHHFRLVGQMENVVPRNVSYVAETSVSDYSHVTVLNRFQRHQSQRLQACPVYQHGKFTNKYTHKINRNKQTICSDAQLAQK